MFYFNILNHGVQGSLNDVVSVFYFRVLNHGVTVVQMIQLTLLYLHKVFVYTLVIINNYNRKETVYTYLGCYIIMHIHVHVHIEIELLKLFMHT